MILSGDVTLDMMINHTQAMLDILAVKELSEYLHARVKAKKPIAIDKLLLLTKTHYVLFPLVDQKSIGADVVKQLPVNSFEYAFYLSLTTEMKLATTEVTEAHKAIFILAADFFNGEAFQTLKTKYLNTFDNDPDKAILNAELLTMVLQASKQNSAELNKFIEIANKRLLSYFINQPSSNSHKATAQQGFIDSDFNVHLLMETHGTADANLIIHQYLQKVGSNFKWPIDHKEIENNILCQIILANKVSFKAIAKLDAVNLGKFDHVVVKNFLKAALEQNKAIDLKPLLRLPNEKFYLYPLVVLGFITLEQAENSFQEGSIETNIVKTQINPSINWKSEAETETIKFMIDFITGADFNSINNRVLIPLQDEINLLNSAKGGYLTSDGSKKSNQIKLVKDEMVSRIVEDFKDLFIHDNTAKKVRVNNKMFSHTLHKDIQKAATFFVLEPNICGHRNLVAHILKKILNVFTFFIRPCLPENFHDRLFSPRSAKTIHQVQDYLEVERKAFAR
jgi:hypothetical protein